jgi:hypothetical protein
MKNNYIVLTFYDVENESSKTITFGCNFSLMDALCGFGTCSHSCCLGN